MNLLDKDRGKDRPLIEKDGFYLNSQTNRHGREGLQCGGFDLNSQEADVGPREDRKYDN